jgi:hypothetical protein
MKVDSKHIAELFTEIKSLLSGVEESVRTGDDGIEDYVISTAEDIKKMVNVFTIDYMTPRTKEPSMPNKYEFQRTAERLLSRQDFQIGGSGHTPSENSALFKNQFYSFLKRELIKHDFTLISEEYKISEYLEVTVLANTKYEEYFFTDFSEDMYRVILLVAKEIVEFKRKNPQLEMFPDKTQPAKASSKLIDLLK